MHKKVNPISFRQSRLNLQGITSNYGVNIYTANLQKYNSENMYISFWLQNELRRWRFFPLKLEIVRSYNGLLTFRLLVFNKIHYRITQFFFFFKKVFFRFFMKLVLFARFKKIRRVFMRNRRYKLRYRKRGKYKWGVTGKILRALSQKRWFRLFRVFSFYLKNYRRIYKSFFPFLKLLYRLVPVFFVNNKYSLNYGYYLHFLVNFIRLNFGVNKIKKKAAYRYGPIIFKKYFFITLQFRRKKYRLFRKFKIVNSIKLKKLLKKKYFFLTKRRFFRKSKKLFLFKKKNINGHKKQKLGVRVQKKKKRKIKKRLLVIKQKKLLKKKLKYTLHLLLNYSRIFVYNIFYTRLLGLKINIEKYAYRVFKQGVFVQVFLLNSVKVLKRERLRKRSQKYIRSFLSKKAKYYEGVPTFYQTFNSFYFFVKNKSFSNLHFLQFCKPSANTLYSTIFRKKGFFFRTFGKKSFWSTKRINFSYNPTIREKKIRLLRNTNLATFLNNFFCKKRFNFLFQPVVNKDFSRLTDFSFLLYSFNRTSLKFILICSANVFIRFLENAVFRTPSKNKILFELRDIIFKMWVKVFLKKKLRVTDCINFFFFKNFLKNGLSYYKKNYVNYPYLNVYQSSPRVFFIYKKQHSYSSHKHSVRTLNALNLIHLNPKLYLRTNDYYVRKRAMDVSIGKYKNLRKRLKFMLFGLYFGNAQVFNEAFALAFKRLRRHGQFLEFFERKLIEIYYNSFLKTGLVGFHMRLRGKIDGNTRRSTKWISFGKSIEAQDITSKLNYNFKPITTFTGVFGMSTWFVYSSLEHANSRENKI